MYIYICIRQLTSLVPNSLSSGMMRSTGISRAGTEVMWSRNATATCLPWAAMSFIAFLYSSTMTSSWCSVSRGKGIVTVTISILLLLLLLELRVEASSMP